MKIIGAFSSFSNVDRDNDIHIVATCINVSYSTGHNNTNNTTHIRIGNINHYKYNVYKYIDSINTFRQNIQGKKGADSIKQRLAECIRRKTAEQSTTALVDWD